MSPVQDLIGIANGSLSMVNLNQEKYPLDRKKRPAGKESETSARLNSQNLVWLGLNLTSTAQHYVWYYSDRSHGVEITLTEMVRLILIKVHDKHYPMVVPVVFWIPEKITSPPAFLVPIIIAFCSYSHFFHRWDPSGK